MGKYFGSGTGIRQHQCLVTNKENSNELQSLTHQEWERRLINHDNDGPEGKATPQIRPPLIRWLIINRMEDLTLDIDFYDLITHPLLTPIHVGALDTILKI